ncbi:MAG: glycosyltransferase family 2 protein [Granulosicoccus sp.]
MHTVSLLALKFLASSPLPARWFYAPVLPQERRASKSGRLSIEIVSHCWQYSRLLSYQLGSLVNHPVQDADVTMTVFYSEEDTVTSELLAMVGELSVPNVCWNWQRMPKEHLFRRAIGRNQAALQSTADWVWFTDCDVVFQQGCIDALNAALQARQDALVFPCVEQRTDIYTDNDLVSQNALEKTELLQASDDLFISKPVTRATGPLQITHGDVSRNNGYCRDVDFYQLPAEHFQKATEDRVFRWLVGTQGTPIDVPGVCRIQHVNKGRYQQGSARTRMRKIVKRWQYSWRNRSGS